jgi:uncharacterized protein YndB with AHSA1/START domain
MENHQLTQMPIAKSEMLIRKPPAQVFEAFVDPEITRKFWFTKSTGRLETGKQSCGPGKCMIIPSTSTSKR